MKWLNTLLNEVNSICDKPEIRFSNKHDKYVIVITGNDLFLQNLEIKIEDSFLKITHEDFSQKINFYQPAETNSLTKNFYEGYLTIEILKKKEKPEDALNRWALSYGM